MIELVEALEAEFGVRFREDQFQERKFATIRGLAEIVAALRGGGGDAS